MVDNLPSHSVTDTNVLSEARIDGKLSTVRSKLGSLILVQSREGKRLVAKAGLLNLQPTITHTRYKPAPRPPSHLPAFALSTSGGMAQRSHANNFVGEPHWKVTGSILVVGL